MRAVKTYTGGKAGAGTYQAVISQIPACRVFVDAMAGGMGITSNLSLPDLTVINDIDISVYNCSLLPAVRAGVMAFNLHYEVLIQCFASFPEVVFYFDPPYHFDTRSTKRRYYKFDWDERDHLDFIFAITAMKCPVIVSHYPCELYDDLLNFPGWRCVDFKSMTRKGLRDERLYMNFPKPSVLQDSRYSGSDYVDRQRMLRKAERWYKKLTMQPAVDQQYILDYMVNAAVNDREK